jgi:hypothetical protein
MSAGLIGSFFGRSLPPFGILPRLAVSSTPIGMPNAPAAQAAAIPPWVPDLFIPIVILLVGALGNKLIRGEQGWKWEDFYLGPDLCLAALSTGLLKVLELVYRNPTDASQGNLLPEDELIVVCVITVTLFLFLLVICFHHDAKQSVGATPKKEPWFLLGFFCNGLGLAMLASFLILLPPL